MLPSWRDQVLIALSPTQLSMLRLRGWFGKRQVVAKHVQPLSPPKVKQALWQPAIEALETVLKEPKWHNAKAKVVISNALVRYTFLPWSDAVLSAAEEQKFVKFKMNEVFGAATKDWDISLAHNNYGHSRLMCAMDSELLSQLRQIASKNHLNLQSVKPHLITALNFWRKYLKGKQLHFLISDGEKLCMAYIRQGHLQSLRVEQANGALSNEMVTASLQREALINHETSEVPAYLFAPGQTKITGNSAQPKKLQRLSLPANYIDSPAAFLAAAQLA